MKQSVFVHFPPMEDAPFVKCRIFDNDYYFLVDSGSNDSLIDSEFFESIDYKGLMVETVPMYTAGGVMERAGEITITIQLQGVTFDISLAVSDLKGACDMFMELLGERPAGILGARFLRENSFVVDFGRQCLYRISTPLNMFKAFSETYTCKEFMILKGPKACLQRHKNRKTVEPFQTLEVEDGSGHITSVRFSSSLGELTLEQISSRQDELYVGYRGDLNAWYLYDAHYAGRTEWEAVDLDIEGD